LGNEINEDYRSSLKAGNFTFTIPDGAVAVQTDAGGKSAISVYQNIDSVYQADGIIYSISIYASSESETDKSYPFEEWLEGGNVTLTERSTIVGGLEFYEGNRGNVDSTNLYHYMAETEGQPAYVIVIPSVITSNSSGKYIQDSLDFDPTEEELKAAQPTG